MKNRRPDYENNNFINIKRPLYILYREDISLSQHKVVLLRFFHDHKKSYLFGNYSMITT